MIFFFFSSRRRHTRFKCDWSSDVCSSDLGHELGEATGDVLAENAVPDAEAVFAGGAELAAVTGEVRVHRHAVADLHALRRRAHLDDLPCDIAARPERQWRFQRRNAFSNEQVEMVQRTRLDAYEDFSRLDLGIGDVRVLELVGSAELAEEKRVHSYLPSERLRRAPALDGRRIIG